jgi:hypothetical protein
MKSLTKIAVMGGLLTLAMTGAATADGGRISISIGGTWNSGGYGYYPSHGYSHSYSYYPCPPPVIYRPYTSYYPPTYSYYYKSRPYPRHDRGYYGHRYDGYKHKGRHGHYRHSRRY